MRPSTNFKLCESISKRNPLNKIQKKLFEKKKKTKKTFLYLICRFLLFGQRAQIWAILDLFFVRGFFPRHFLFFRSFIFPFLRFYFLFSFQKVIRSLFRFLTPPTAHRNPPPTAHPTIDGVEKKSWAKGLPFKTEGQQQE